MYPEYTENLQNSIVVSKQPDKRSGKWEDHIKTQKVAIYKPRRVLRRN